MKRKKQASEAKIRRGFTRDTDFIVSGVMDIFRTETEDEPQTKDFQRKYSARIEKLLLKALRKGEVRISEINGKNVGFVWFEKTLNSIFGLRYPDWSKKYCWICWAYVKEGFRGASLGTLMYNDIESMCKKEGLKSIGADFHLKNTRSKKFHYSLGFKPVYQVVFKDI